MPSLLSLKYIDALQRRVRCALPLFVMFISNMAFSCTKISSDLFSEWNLVIEEQEEIIPVLFRPYRDWESESVIHISPYGNLNFSHQSAAVYSSYAFFVTKGRSKIGLYNLEKKEMIFTLSLRGVNGDTYHCNQCTFGVEKFEEFDFFPLLYVSQRAKSDGRCFIEAYRIFPLYNEDLSEFDSFYVELVQTIYLPKMTHDNSLGNANCVIDASSGTMYTYSRNNNTKEDNYGQCRITQFEIPDIHQKTVILNDGAILSSYAIDVSAIKMQGG